MESDEEEEEQLDSDGSDVLASIISTAVKSDGFFRHQQVGEGELAAEEKEKIVKELVQSKPALFLQRFGRFLSVVQLQRMLAASDPHFSEAAM